jgi:dUTP pyrophosphatase
MEINVKLDEGAFIPERAHDTDAGADIRTPIDIVVEPHDSVIIATGVHVETPPNCVTMIKSKSGLNIKNNITSEGVIDEGFSGEVMVKLYNHGPIAKQFKRGDKITQIVVLPVVYPTYVQAERISYGDRGVNGYGSTGR